MGLQPAQTRPTVRCQAAVKSPEGATVAGRASAAGATRRSGGDTVVTGIAAGNAAGAETLTETGGTRSANPGAYMSCCQCSCSGFLTVICDQMHIQHPGCVFNNSTHAGSCSRPQYTAVLLILEETDWTPSCHHCTVLVKVCISHLQGSIVDCFLRGCALDPTEACLCRSKRSRSRDRDAERPKRSRHDRSHHSRDKISPAADKQHAGEEDREGGSKVATSAPAFVPKAQPKGLVVVKAKKFDGCYPQLVDAMLDSQPRQVGTLRLQPFASEHLPCILGVLQQRCV